MCYSIEGEASVHSVIFNVHFAFFGARELELGLLAICLLPLSCYNPCPVTPLVLLLV